MKGIYNGTSMRAFKYFPRLRIQESNLSKEAVIRLAWLDWYFSHGKNAEVTCRHFGISKSVFYRWKNRFNPNNLKSLEFDTKKRRPDHLRIMTTPQYLINLVVEIRRGDLEKSKYEIQAELKERGCSLGTSTIQKVINQRSELANAIHRKRLAKHQKLSIARIRAEAKLRDKSLGSLVQIDTKHLYILGVRFYLFVAVDCKSRLGFVWCYRSISSASAADFLTRVLKAFPFAVVAINTDNGSEYLLRFHQACENLGITHYFSYPNTPKMNGRVERLIQTTESEFFDYQDDLLPNIDEINKRCEIFNHKYNHQRYHQALGYQTPATYVTNYLKQKGEQPFSIWVSRTCS